jgi:uncharacterized membrane protein YsdA (DUF1294 family)
MAEYAVVIVTYLVVVSLMAIGLTLYDKRAANRGAWRIKESTLLLVAVFGGSVAMFAAMRLIRHKTKHLKFMLGIPLIFVVQIAAVLIARWLVAGNAL